MAVSIKLAVFLCTKMVHRNIRSRLSADIISPRGSLIEAPSPHQNSASATYYKCKNLQLEWTCAKQQKATINENSVKLFLIKQQVNNLAAYFFIFFKIFLNIKSFACHQFFTEYVSIKIFCINCCINVTMLKKAWRNFSENVLIKL
jgi:hypothetical protein